MKMRMRPFSLISILSLTTFSSIIIDSPIPPAFPEEAKYYLDFPKAQEIHEIEAKSTLTFVHILYRHGDRTPSILLPNDPNNGESTWKEGLGEVTLKGIQQQYRLGQWLRRRYSQFLGEQLSRKDIYVRSSDYSRTIMSALANLAGMFPTNNSDRLEDKIQSIPIPVHTVEKERDILNFDNAFKQLNEQISCPKANEALDSISSDPRVQEIEEAHADLLAYLQENSGVKKPLRLRGMWSVFDALNCEFHHQETHKWPSWMNMTIWGRVQQLYDQSSQFSFHNPQLRRLRGGALVAEIFDRIRAKLNGSLEYNGPRKAHVYSAHDITLSACLSTFGIVPHVFPLYSSAVLIELHRIQEKDIIEIYYKNITDSGRLFQMEIPGCAAPCEIGMLEEKMKSLFPLDWHAECGDPIPSNTVLWVAIAALSLSNIICLSIICVDMIIRRRPMFRRRLPRPSEINLMGDDEEESDLNL